MSQENVEVVRSSIEAFLRNDLDAAISSLDPAVAWVEMPSLGPDASTYRGKDEVLDAIQSWMSIWTEYGLEVERYIDAGDQVVALFREQGQVSGAAVKRELAYVCTFQASTVVLVRLYGAWAEALEAVGLSE
jgi:ketosteroid isomerase-like protein